MAAVNEHVFLAEEEEDDDESGSDMDFGEEEDDESGCDMEFGEFDLSGARSLHGQQAFVAGYEDDDEEDEDDCGAQFSVRPYRGGALAREAGNLQLSGFTARSDGPELTDQHEVTSYDMRRLVRLALEGDCRSMEDDEAYQRALAGGEPVSRVSRAAMVDLALRSANNEQQQQQPKSPSQIFPMRTGF